MSDNVLIDVRNLKKYYNGGKVKAFAEGIDEHGRLIAAFPNGETKTVDAADVSVRTAERMPE